MCVRPVWEGLESQLPLPIQRLILSPVQLLIISSMLRASMGYNTTFKCNPPPLMLISHRTSRTHPPPFRSKAHFSQALLDQYSQQQKQKQERAKNSSSASGNDAIGGDQGGGRKKHPCPHDGCPNIYRQKSGLRYHLSHVSIDDTIRKSPPAEAYPPRDIRVYLLFNYR